MRKNRYLSPPKEIPPHHQSENLQNRNEPNIPLYTRSRTPQTLDPSNKTLRQSLNTQLACTYRSQPLDLEREQGCFTKLAAEKKSTVVGIQILRKSSPVLSPIRTAVL